MCFAYIDLFLCLFDYLLINSDKKIIVAVWVWHDQTNVTDSSQQLNLALVGPGSAGRHGGKIRTTTFIQFVDGKWKNIFCQQTVLELFFVY